MAEVWDQVTPFHTARQQCVDDIEVIKKTCAEEHSKKTVFECPDCYGRLIERMKSRYVDSTGPEWFSGRPGFLHSIDTAFEAAKAFEADPRSIEGIVQDEKRKWYLENVRNSVIRIIAEDSLGTDTLMEMLGSRDFPLEDLTDEIRQALEQSTADAASTGPILEKLTATSKLEEQVPILKEALFATGADQTVPENQRAYLEMLEQGEHARDVVERIVEDRQASIGARDQEERHKRRIDELQRARTAHELQKTQRKDDKDSSAKQRVPDDMYYLPACYHCGGNPSTKRYLSCELCQLLSDKHIVPLPIVYCSERCYSFSHDEHTEDAHYCASGDTCVRLTDEDEDMDAGHDVFYICEECIHSLQTESVFCSPRCADVNFQKHRDTIHIPEREKQGIITDDADKLVFSKEDPTRYHARDIGDHITSLDDAMRDYQGKLGIGITSID